MMRLMDVRARTSLAALVVIASLSGCGSEGMPVAAGEASTAQRLLAAADAAAKSNGGRAKHVEAVETTRGKAAELTGHSNSDQSEVVWVVEVSGDRYVCGACSMPAGAAAPHGDHLTMVLRAADFQSTDGGIGPAATDLAALGDVQVLRDGG
jgi:hypothetical protein